MNSNVISGSLVYKGETGLSAYELAVQNGYTGSVTDWLATLGTSSHFDRTSVVYETEEADQTVFDLPTGYTSSCFIEVFVAGKKEKDEDITIDVTEQTVTLTNAVATVGTEVEVVMTLMSTNELPISDTIGDYSTNLTASGTKSVYDYVEGRGFVDISKIKSISLDKITLVPVSCSQSSFNVLIDAPLDISTFLGVTGIKVTYHAAKDDYGYLEHANFFYDSVANKICVIVMLPEGILSFSHFETEIDITYISN